MKSLCLTTVMPILLLIMQIEAHKELSDCGRLELMTISNHTHHWPWHAAIFHHVKKDVRNYKCGGTLISSNAILTAAHCVSQYNFPIETNEVSVALGRLNLGINETSAQDYEVADIILHPNFTEIDYNNDIAIIRLSSDATFNNYVRPICLWDSNKTEFSTIEGREGTVVGWGKTDDASNILRKASLSVLPLFRCLSSNRFFFGLYISQNNFCAGLGNGTRVCFGDSGGSMTFKKNGMYFIRGIVSVSPPTQNKNSQRLCDAMQYVLLTDVAKYLPWIEDVAFECEVKIPCDKTYEEREYFVCEIQPSFSEEKCSPIFEEFANVTLLRILGFNYFPDFSDANNKFKNLKVVEVTYQLKLVERAKLAAFKRIEKLYLEENYITELHADTFNDLKNLTDLVLDGNKLKELHVDVFSELRNLTTLSLFKNHIEILPADIFRNNKQLEKIYLRQNKLDELHPDLFVRVRNLKKLSFRDNRIKIVPPNIFRNNFKLEDLNLAYNKIEQIHPDLFAELTHLKNLVLNNNQITILSSNLFRNNAGLELLYVSYNEIHLDLDLFVTLGNLVTVSFDGNQIESLPLNLFRNNRKLLSLHLADNKIQEIHPDLFAELRNLTKLFLSYNQIETLPANLFRNNPKLVTIEIEQNRLKELHPDIFKGLDNLEELFLNDNQIEILPQSLFRDNKKLSNIRFGYNKIKTIELDFINLPNLVHIDFSSNICICFETLCTTTWIEMREKFQGNCTSI